MRLSIRKNSKTTKAWATGSYNIVNICVMNFHLTIKCRSPLTLLYEILLQLHIFLDWERFYQSSN